MATSLAASRSASALLAPAVAAGQASSSARRLAGSAARVTAAGGCRTPSSPSSTRQYVAVSAASSSSRGTRAVAAAAGDAAGAFDSNDARDDASPSSVSSDADVHKNATNPPPSSSTSSTVNRRSLVAGAPMLMLSLACSQAATAMGDDDEDLDEEAAQAAIEASMKSVLEVNSGEMSYPLQTAFDAASSSSSTPVVMPASFEVSNLWVVSPMTQEVNASTAAGSKSVATWGSIVDPVNGKVVTSVTVTATKAFPAASIQELGKPENVSVVGGDATISMSTECTETCV